MLTDEHIQFANELLRDQLPDARGLQWTVLEQILAFQKTDPPFMQVLFNNAMHWVTVEAVDDATIRVYDSTNCRPNLSVQVQTSSMMQTAKEQITFQLEKMQVQKGAVDCGLFANAYVTELCHGNCPTDKLQV